MKNILRTIHKFIKRIDKFFHNLFSLESDPLSNPLSGDRCIEYAFVVKHMINLNKNLKVLDIGCSGSPLTTILHSMGFSYIQGIGLLPSPVQYENLKYIQGNFLISRDLDSSYDVVILCSTIEHIGLKGRYNSPSIRNGDIVVLRRVKELLTSKGILILTVPYGVEKIIMPFHRVYNKRSRMLKYAFKNFEVIAEEYYKNNSHNTWVKCSEQKAASVIPSVDNYALGLFVFRKV